MVLSAESLNTYLKYVQGFCDAFVMSASESSYCLRVNKLIKIKILFAVHFFAAKSKKTNLDICNKKVVLQIMCN